MDAHFWKNARKIHLISYNFMGKHAFWTASFQPGSQYWVSPLFIQSISFPNRPTCYHDNLKWSLLQTFQRWILRGCVHMGRSRLGSVIRGHSDHDTSKKSFNPFPGCIRQFVWRAMIRVTSDYWSWSESPHWNAPLGALPGYESCYVTRTVSVEA